MINARGRSRGVVFLAFIVAATLATIGYLQDAPVWWGWTPTVVSSWTGQNTFVWVIGAALSAWLTYPAFSNALRDRVALGQRSPRELVASAWRPAVLVVVSASLVPLGIGLVWQATQSPMLTGWPNLVLWVSSTLMIGIFFVFLGTLCGVVVRSVAAPLVAAVLTYLFVLIPAYTLESNSWDMLAPDYGFVFFDTVPSLAAVTLRLIVWAAAAGLMLSIIAKSKASISIMAGITAVAVAAAVTVGSEFTRPKEFEKETCVQINSTHVCVPPMLVVGMNEYTGFLKEGLSKLPTAFNPQLIVATADQPSASSLTAGVNDRQVVLIGLINGTTTESNLPQREEVLIKMGNVLLMQDNCPDPSADNDQSSAAMRDAPDLVLGLWWKLELGLSVERAYGFEDFTDPTWLDPADFNHALQKAKKLHALPEGKRDALLTKLRPQLLTCTAKVRLPA